MHVICAVCKDVDVVSLLVLLSAICKRFIIYSLYILFFKLVYFFIPMYAPLACRFFHAAGLVKWFVYVAIMSILCN
jgi:hypothetical protein